MKNGRMQAKDITSLAFLQAVVVCGIERERLWANRWDVTAVLAGYPECIKSTPRVYPELPVKVVLAKAKALISAGIIDGCACGCRGDWELMPETAEVLGLVKHPGPVEFWTLPESVPKLIRRRDGQRTLTAASPP